MKKLSIEEKAKRYDEAIPQLKGLLDGIHEEKCDIMEEDIIKIFPELKESEDERIRKFLITFFINDYGKNSNARFAGIKVKDIISWLEKQAEQKPNPCDGCINRKGCINCENGELRETEQKPAKVEPKFKVGDYVKNINDKREPIYEIVYMDKECYICEYRGKESIGDKAVMHFTFDNPYLRLVEQKPAWSKEVKEAINSSIAHFKRELADVKTGKILCKKYAKHIKVLESIKDRYTWKPSDEQMKILNEVLNFAANHESPHWNDYIFGTLNNLIRQLKRLREEDI